MQCSCKDQRLKKEFILTVRGPALTQELCQRHFSSFDISEVKGRVVDQSGTTMVFVHMESKIRTHQLVAAVNAYNKAVPAHLKLHWAGSTEEENIRSAVGTGKRLNSTPAYKYIMQRDQTFFEWKSPIKDLNTALAKPFQTPEDSFKRNPKRIFETMNEDEMYKDLNALRDPSPRKRSIVSDTESDKEDDAAPPRPPALPYGPAYPVAQAAPPRLVPVVAQAQYVPGSSRLAPYAEAIPLLAPQVVRGYTAPRLDDMAYALDAMQRRSVGQPEPQPEVQPEVALPPPEVQPEVALPQPESQPVVVEPQAEPQQGTHGDMVSLAALTNLIQPLIDRVHHVTDVAFSAQSQTIRLLSHHFGLPPSQPVAQLDNAPLQPVAQLDNAPLQLDHAQLDPLHPPIDRVHHVIQ